MAFTNEKDTSGYVDKLVNVGRVAKVVKGGRRFAFTAIVVVGDESGRVGWGSGKAREVPEAVRKATDVAKKRMVRVPLREGRTIHHNARGVFGGAQVFMKPATPGTGIIAGGPMRAVFESMGMKDVVAKSLGSSNPYNLIQATFEAFESMETPRSISAKRGLKMSELRERREYTGFDFSQQAAQQASQETGTEQTETKAEPQVDKNQKTKASKKAESKSGENSAKPKQEKTKQSAAKEAASSQKTENSKPSTTASATKDGVQKDSAEKKNSGNSAASTKTTASKSSVSKTGASKTKASASSRTTAEKSGAEQKKTNTAKPAEEKKS